MPISPAAQKFHLLILCSALDNSVAVVGSSIPALMLGKRHIADMNQNIAEPHAVTIIATSMYDFITAPSLSPKVLERRRAQLRVAHRMLDRSMAEPVLNSTRLVASIRQRIAAGVAQHVGVYRKAEASALADALNQAINRVRGEWSAALGGEHECAVG